MREVDAGWLTSREVAVYERVMALQWLSHLPPSVFIEVNDRFHKLCTNRKVTSIEGRKEQHGS